MKKNPKKKIDTEELLIKHAEELLTVDVCHIIFCKYFMEEKIMNYRVSMFAVTVVVLAVVCAIFPVHADTEIFENTYQIEPDTVLELDNRNGRVTIEQWDQVQVSVWAEKKTRGWGKLENVEIRVSTGKTLLIETVELVKNPRVSVDYAIKVPADFTVSSVRTSNGAIQIEGVQGNMELKTSNGRIEAKHVKGNLTANTSNGRIKMSDIQGIVKAESSNGSIEMTEVLGIRGAETSNGSIEVEIATIDDHEMLLKTSNGSITLYVSPDLQATFDMKTSNGEITLHDDLELTVSGGISKTKLQGKLGGGGPEISMKTSNGNINLHALR